MIIEGHQGKYEVGKVVAETATYRLRLGIELRTQRSCLVQVALGTQDNGAVDRNVYFLNQLAARAQELEEGYAAVKTNPAVMLNYQFGFPAVLDTFRLAEQGDRQIAVLAFQGVQSVSDYWPLSRMIDSGRRVDIRTSAWMFGKLLKLLTFAHSQDILVGDMSASNILIHPGQHYVVIFDWTNAKASPEGVTAEAARGQISKLAEIIIDVVGGESATRTVPEHGNENGRKPYADHLFQLAAGGSASAEDAHKAFYAKLKSMGWKSFHPFTDYAR